MFSDEATHELVVDDLYLELNQLCVGLGVRRADLSTQLGERLRELLRIEEVDNSSQQQLFQVVQARLEEVIETLDANEEGCKPQDRNIARVLLNISIPEIAPLKITERLDWCDNRIIRNEYNVMAASTINTKAWRERILRLIAQKLISLEADGRLPSREEVQSSLGSNLPEKPEPPRTNETDSVDPSEVLTSAHDNNSQAVASSSTERKMPGAKNIFEQPVSSVIMVGQNNGIVQVPSRTRKKALGRRKVLFIAVAVGVVVIMMGAAILRMTEAWQEESSSPPGIVLETNGGSILDESKSPWGDEAPLCGDYDFDTPLVVDDPVAPLNQNDPSLAGDLFHQVGQGWNPWVLPDVYDVSPAAFDPQQFIDAGAIKTGDIDVKLQFGNSSESQYLVHDIQLEVERSSVVSGTAASAIGGDNVPTPLIEFDLAHETPLAMTIDEDCQATRFFDSHYIPVDSQSVKQLKVKLRASDCLCEVRFKIHYFQDGETDTITIPSENEPAITVVGYEGVDYDIVYKFYNEDGEVEKYDCRTSDECQDLY